MLCFLALLKKIDLAYWLGVLLLVFSSANGQVDGRYFLQLQTVSSPEMEAIVSPFSGSLVFNTTIDNVCYYNSSTSNWIPLSSPKPIAARWTYKALPSKLNAKNLNTTALTQIPIFSQLDFNEDGNLYVILPPSQITFPISGSGDNQPNEANTTLQISKQGTYRFMLNLAIEYPNAPVALNTRVGLRVALLKNGSINDISFARGGSSFIRLNSGHFKSSIHINEVLQLDAQDVLVFFASRLTENSDSANFNLILQNEDLASSFSIFKMN